MAEQEKHKDFILIVNTRKKEWDRETISYKEAVVLAFGKHSEDENTTYTVDYSKGPRENPEGSLTKGQSVKVKNEMIFNVTETHKS